MDHIYFYPNKSLKMTAIDYLARPVQILLNTPTTDTSNAYTTIPPLSLRVTTLAVVILLAYVAPFFAAVGFGAGVLALVIKPFFFEVEKIKQAKLATETAINSFISSSIKPCPKILENPHTCREYLWKNLEINAELNVEILNGFTEQEKLKTLSFLINQEFQNGFINFLPRIPLYLALIEKTNRLHPPYIIPFLSLLEKDTPDIMLGKFTFYLALVKQHRMVGYPLKAPEGFDLGERASDEAVLWLESLNQFHTRIKSNNLEDFLAITSHHPIGSLNGQKKTEEEVLNIMVGLRNLTPQSVIDLRTIWVANVWLTNFYLR